MLGQLGDLSEDILWHILVVRVPKMVRGWTYLEHVVSNVACREGGWPSNGKLRDMEIFFMRV